MANMSDIWVHKNRRHCPECEGLFRQQRYHRDHTQSPSQLIPLRQICGDCRRSFYVIDGAAEKLDDGRVISRLQGHDLPTGSALPEISADC